MKKNEYYYIRKYIFLCSIFSIFLILIWIVICLSIQSAILKLLSLLSLFLLIKPTISFIANKTILDLLFRELDAQMFFKIINYRYFHPNFGYQINGAISIGDYQSVVNIATAQIQKKKCSLKNKLLYLSILARAYFELRDFQKLEELYAKYEEYKNIYPNKSYFKKVESLWKYYQYFLGHNYEACQAICESKEITLKRNFSCEKYSRLLNNFYYAVACYSSGNIAVAKQSFEKIILTAPKIYLSKISQKYIDSINTNSEITVIDETVPEKGYQLYDCIITKKTRQHKIITVILLIIVCASIMALLALDCAKKKEQNQREFDYNSALAEYEKKLNDALSTHYDNSIYVKYFDIKDQDDSIDTFCLIDNGNCLDLASIVTYDGGESLDLILLVENIQIPYDYSVKSAVSNYQIAFYISDKQIISSDYKEIIEYSYNGINYWIGIKHVNQLP